VKKKKKKVLSSVVPRFAPVLFSLSLSLWRARAVLWFVPNSKCENPKRTSQTNALELSAARKREKENENVTSGKKDAETSFVFLCALVCV
jgi:hypothetical protein